MKTFCGVLSGVFFALTLGIVGSIEQNAVPLGIGAFHAFVFEALFAVFAKLAGAFDPVPCKERRKRREVQSEDPDPRPGRTSRQSPDPYGRPKSYR